MKIKNFRDVLAILVAVVIFPAIWILHGKGVIAVPGEVLGVTVSIETMVAMFYYRKKETTPTP